MQYQSDGKSLKQVFSETVKQILQDRDMTQAELAARLDSTPQAVNRVLSGERAPSLDTVEKFADALNVPPSRLMEHEFRPEKWSLSKDELFSVVVDGIAEKTGRFPQEFVKLVKEFGGYSKASDYLKEELELLRMSETAYVKKRSEIFEELNQLKREMKATGGRGRSAKKKMRQK